jgi:aspartyl-tRNA(Asn)/glutamyl-tRNA(Gln) amidotransferase subunit A
LPALTLPNGLAEKGLPSGIALLGPAFGEATLLQIGKRYQQRTAFHTLRPALIAQPPGA